MNRVAHVGVVLLDDLGCLDGDGAGVALGGGTGDVADGVLTLRRLVVLRPVIDVLVVADDPHASADRTLDVLLAGLLGGAQGMEGDRQFGLSDPLFAIPLQFNGLFGGFTGNQRMNRVAHVGVVLLDEFGCLDGDGAGVAIGGGAHDIADGVLTLRRLILLFAVVDVLVIADNRHASADRALDGLLVRLYGLPLSGINGIIGHGLGNLGIPAVEHKALTGGRALKTGSRVLELCRVDLVSENLLTVHTIGVSHGVGVLFPVGIEVRPAIHGLAGHIAGLTLAAPEQEVVAGAGRSGRVHSGQSISLAHGGAVQ